MKTVYIGGMGKRIREVRESLGMSREKLAEHMQISSRYLAEVENENKTMSFSTMSKTCVALSISADYLMFGRSEKANTDLILEMLSNLEQEQVDYAREILKMYVLAVGKSKL